MPLSHISTTTSLPDLIPRATKYRLSLSHLAWNPKLLNKLFFSYSIYSTHDQWIKGIYITVLLLNAYYILAVFKSKLNLTWFWRPFILCISPTKATSALTRPYCCKAIVGSGRGLSSITAQPHPCWHLCSTLATLHPGRLSLLYSAERHPIHLSSLNLSHIASTVSQ